MPTFRNTRLPVYEDGKEYSETLAFKPHTPVNHPEESIQNLNFLAQEGNGKSNTLASLRRGKI
jgi:hypothetical protein